MSSAWPVGEDGTLVIGDLHLDPKGGADVREFSAFCTGLEAPRLVILGDLFDAWFGPSTQGLTGAQEVTSALAQLTQRGVAVDVIPGNRDFLLDEEFSRISGAHLFPSGWRREFHGQRTLILHGDTLCTLDHSYQRLRRFLHSGFVRGLSRCLPRWMLLRLAGRLRAASRRAVARKSVPSKTMQDQAALEAAAGDSGVEPAQVLVVGHAHEFSDRNLGAPPLRWLVLDGWGGERDTLRLGTASGPTSLSHRDLMTSPNP